jgi:hypothetical protein
MATTRTFQDMLNEYLTYDLLKEEYTKRSWLMSELKAAGQIDEGWKGGTLPVPFKGAQASSLKFGGLTAEGDIAEDKYVRGEVTDYREVWGTLLFNHRDLLEHDGSVKEKTFLRLLPDVIEDYMEWMKENVNLNMLVGAAKDKAAADGTAAAGIQVVRPDRFSINEKVIVDSDTQAAVTGYVRTIDINSGVIVIFDARTGGAVLDLSAYLVADNTVFYVDGANTDSFTSLKESLLSAANGGSATLYGQTKTAYPYLQSIQVDGSAVTASNILEKLFDGYTRVKTLGKGMPSKLVMSFKNLGSIMKILEQDKGPYHIDQKSTKVNAYGWTEITVIGVKGELRIVGINEMDDDFIMYLDMRAVKFHSNGMFRKRTAPDGKQYYEVRTTAGYFYLLDMSLYGELILNRPSYCGIMHSISY